MPPKRNDRRPERSLASGMAGAIMELRSVIKKIMTSTST